MSVQSITVPDEIATTIPGVLDLDSAGRVFLLTWLHFEVLVGNPITADVWREAWGRAADYQTVVAAREVLR